MPEKQKMMSEHVGNSWPRFECCIRNTKEVRSSNKFKKHWSARVTDEFSSETLILRKNCPVCTRGASSFRRDPLYSFAHAMRAKWWYHAKFQHFQNSISPSFSSLNKSVNDWKTANEVRKGWKLMAWLWMVHTECTKKSGVEISIKHEMPL